MQCIDNYRKYPTKLRNKENEKREIELLVMINPGNSRHIQADIKHNHPGWMPNQWVNNLIKTSIELKRKQNAIRIARKKSRRNTTNIHHRGSTHRKKTGDKI